MDTIFQNEPVDALRTITVKLVTPTNQTAIGVSGATIKIAKSGNNFVTASASDVVEITGGGESLYTFQLSKSECDTIGDLLWTVSKPGTILVSSGSVTISLFEGLFRGSIASASDATHFTLDSSAPAIANYFAGGGRSCIAVFKTGALVGQSVLVSTYSSGRICTATSPGLTATPTTGDIVELVPYTGQLDAATITSIDSSVLTALTTLQTSATDIQNRLPDVLDGGFIKAKVEALGSGIAATIGAAVWDLATTGHRTTGTFGELLQVVAGLLHMHGRIDQTVFGTNQILTFARLRCFASASAAASAVDGHSDGTDGEIFRFSISSVDSLDNGKYSGFKIVRTL